MSLIGHDERKRKGYLILLSKDTIVWLLLSSQSERSSSPIQCRSRMLPLMSSLRLLQLSLHWLLLDGI